MEEKKDITNIKKEIGKVTLFKKLNLFKGISLIAIYLHLIELKKRMFIFEIQQGRETKVPKDFLYGC